MNVILLVGKSYAGKSHIAKILEKDFGYKEYSLGDCLKDIYCQLNPSVKIETLYHRTDKEEHRKNLINLAENILKPYFDEKCFCEALYKKIMKDKNKKITISDIRHEIELTYFKEKFPISTSILIINPDNETTYDMEVDKLLCDIEFVNDFNSKTTIEDFRTVFNQHIIKNCL